MPYNFVTKEPIPGLANLLGVLAQTVYKFRINPFVSPLEFLRAKLGLGALYDYD